MNDSTRTLNVSVEGETVLPNMINRFMEAIDAPFMADVCSVDFISAETKGIAPGEIQLEVDSDPEAMMVEADWMLGKEFDNVSVNIAPTDEEIEAAVEAHEDYIASLPESETQPENHKVDS